MASTTEYIESYFLQTLSKDERVAFEARCETDEAFATEVAFYITARQALREALLEQKQQQWKEEVAAEKEVVPFISITRKSTFGRWIAYAAAACLLLAISVYLFEARTTPQKLATRYLNEDSRLSQTMDASHDSIELGIASYKNKNYNEALQLFQGVEQKDPTNSDAKKYIGLTYLQQENYEEAIQEFDELSNMHGLHSNPGDFLKAAALLKRNDPGDEEEAQRLLRKVVNEKEEGSEIAEEWLKKF